MISFKLEFLKGFTLEHLFVFSVFNQGLCNFFHYLGNSLGLVPLFEIGIVLVLNLSIISVLKKLWNILLKALNFLLEIINLLINNIKSR